MGELPNITVSFYRLLRQCESIGEVMVLPRIECRIVQPLPARVAGSFGP